VTTKRAGIRHRRRIRVTIGGAPAFTLNVGVGGFSAEIMRVYLPGTAVWGTIQLGGADLGYAGHVAWARPGDPRVQLRGRLGVRFTDLSPEARMHIRAGFLGCDPASGRPSGT
jgi:hypothetical protein